MRIVVEGIQPLVFHVFLLYFHYGYRFYYAVVIGNGGIVGIIGIIIGIAMPLLFLFLG